MSRVTCKSTGRWTEPTTATGNGPAVEPDSVIDPPRLEASDRRLSLPNS